MTADENASPRISTVITCFNGAAYLGEAPGDLSSLENPQAVDEIAGQAPTRRG